MQCLRGTWKLTGTATIRLERVTAEIEALSAELARAIGLGGRDRGDGADRHLLLLRAAIALGAIHRHI